MTGKICIVLTTRGNYAKMKSTMRAIRSHPNLALQVVLAGGILQDRFGDYGPIIEADGFAIDRKVDFLIEGGETLIAMTKSAGRATELLGEAFAELEPNVILVIADRYEAMSVALAATCMNLPIAHLEGGEISGSIDERLRHAITQLAHIHFPANDAAAERILRLGAPAESVFTVGTPSLDLLEDFDLGDTARLFDLQARAGNGDEIDYRGDYVVVSQHPVVTEYAATEEQIRATAAAIDEIGLPAVWLTPNMDAGGDGVARAIARHRNQTRRIPVRYFASMKMGPYATLLRNSRCLVGNSSSGIRECAFLGVPVVNIGTRQKGRARGANVIDVGHEARAIVEATRRQIAHGRYPSDPIYGDGRSGERIAAALATTFGAATAPTLPAAAVRS